MRIMKEEDDTRCKIGEEVQYRGWWGTWFIRTDLLSLVVQQHGSSVHISQHQASRQLTATGGTQRSHRLTIRFPDYTHPTTTVVEPPNTFPYVSATAFHHLPLQIVSCRPHWPFSMLSLTYSNVCTCDCVQYTYILHQYLNLRCDWCKTSLKSLEGVLTHQSDIIQVSKRHPHFTRVTSVKSLEGILTLPESHQSSIQTASSLTRVTTVKSLEGIL